MPNNIKCYSGGDVRRDDPNDRILIVKRNFWLASRCYVRVGDIVRFNGKSIVVRPYALMSDYDYETNELGAIQWAMKRKWLVDKNSDKLTIKRMVSIAKKLPQKLPQKLMKWIHACSRGAH